MQQDSNNTDSEMAPVTAVSAPKYGSYLNYIKLDRPEEGRPILIILGNMEQFVSSALFKASRGGLFRAKHISTATDDELNRDSTRFIKWSPDSIYQIDLSERSKIPIGKRIINDTHFNCKKSTVQSEF